MKTIGILEATNSLSQLVDQALAGEEILLTRQGKPVVRLAAVPTGHAQTASMDWVAESRARRVGAGVNAVESAD